MYTKIKNLMYTKHKIELKLHFCHRYKCFFVSVSQVFVLPKRNNDNAHTRAHAQAH